ncbi:MAG: RagB/SusD family nutrient uptake outer membrane protein [Bacteroidetes bacterium]|nr:RagB/SusD family nutrient uptake outer membrane protein [Bacteroidota bacterium]
MKKYSIICICLLSLITVTFYSCKKFLDQQPISLITTDNAYTTAANIEAALNGAYSSFMGTNYYQWEYIEQSDMRSDNAYAGGSGDIDFLQVDLNTISNANGLVYRDWTELYASIAKCNAVLDNIENVTDPLLTDERRKQIIGEASFLRAFHYYQLVKLWGGVPIEKHSNSTDPSVIRIARSADTAVYNFINDDLQVAVANLPDVYDGADGSTNKVRATKGAANALLAKIWAQRPDRDYNKVLQYCNAVINSPAGYQMLNNYADLFDGNHPFNSESILEIPYIANTPQACWGAELFYPTHNDNGKVPSDAWQRYCVPSKTLVNLYETEGDSIRENANISFETVPWADQNWNPCAKSNIKVPFDVKQKHPNNWSSGDHVYLLRLADIILLKAEAQNELGDPAAAAITLNEVRNRVHLSTVIATSQSQMRSAIINERQLELAFEGQRWDDLKRFGIAVSVMNGLDEKQYTCNDGNASTPTSINYNLTTATLLLPIPLLEMQANPSLIQNPGY